MPKKLKPVMVSRIEHLKYGLVNKLIHCNVDPGKDQVAQLSESLVSHYSGFIEWLEMGIAAFRGEYSIVDKIAVDVRTCLIDYFDESIAVELQGMSLETEEELQKIASEKSTKKSEKNKKRDEELKLLEELAKKLGKKVV